MKKIIILLAVLSSALLAAPEIEMSRPTRETLQFEPISYPMATRFSTERLYAMPVGEDLWQRSLYSFSTGVIVGTCIGLSQGKDFAKDFAEKKPLANAQLFQTAITLPILCFTFYPGQTSYDKGAFGNWCLVTLGRYFCNSLGVALGAGLGLSLGMNATK